MATRPPSAGLHQLQRMCVAVPAANTPLFGVAAAHACAGTPGHAAALAAAESQLRESLAATPGLAGLAEGVAALTGIAAHALASLPTAVCAVAHGPVHMLTLRLGLAALDRSGFLHAVARGACGHRCEYNLAYGVLGAAASAQQIASRCGADAVSGAAPTYVIAARRATEALLALSGAADGVRSSLGAVQAALDTAPPASQSVGESGQAARQLADCLAAAVLITGPCNPSLSHLPDSANMGCGFALLAELASALTARSDAAAEASASERDRASAPASDVHELRSASIDVLLALAALQMLAEVHAALHVSAHTADDDGEQGSWLMRPLTQRAGGHVDDVRRTCGVPSLVRVDKILLEPARI